SLLYLAQPRSEPRARSTRSPPSTSPPESRATRCSFWPRLSGLDCGRQLGRGAEGLEDDAVALGQGQQSRQLLVVGIGVEVEAEADRAEADRGVAVDRQRAAEV